MSPEQKQDAIQKNIATARYIFANSARFDARLVEQARKIIDGAKAKRVQTKSKGHA